MEVAVGALGSLQGEEGQEDAHVKEANILFCKTQADT